MLWFVVGLWLPALAAYPWVAYGDRDARSGAATVFLRAGLALGIGVGLSACTYFLWLFFAGASGKTYQICELAVCAAIGLFGWALCGLWGLQGGQSHFRRTKIGTVPGETGTVPYGPTKIGTVPCEAIPKRWQRLLILAFVAALALAVVGAVGNYCKEPLGDWDAWTIWNQRARFFFRAGAQWRQAFSPAFAHTDYPLLLPSSNARLWSYLGRECTWVPWLLGSLFTLATAGILTAGVCRLRSQSQGLLAGLALLGTVSFLHAGLCSMPTFRWPSSFYPPCCCGPFTMPRNGRAGNVWSSRGCWRGWRLGPRMKGCCC